MRAHLSLLRLNYSLNKFKYKVMQKIRRKWFGTSPNRKFILLLQTIFLISGLLCGGNTRVWGQSAPKVSIDLKHVTFVKVIESLRQQTGYEFVFNAQEVAHVKDVSLSLKNVLLQVALDSLVKGKGLTYSITGQTVVVKKQKAEPEVNLLKVSGRIVDEKGNSIPGATVLIQGTTQGVASDADGRYSISAKPTDALRISFIGYKTEVVAVDGKTKLNVTLNPTAENIEEVTVVAFGEQKKESVVGSITTVRPMDLKSSNSDLTASFVGKIAGIVGFQTGGRPGALTEEEMNTKFYVRGLTSFQQGANTAPLILLDGVETSVLDLSRIAPEDIESFSVMKDASATAMYGARGANGVILVTTKKGAEGSVYTSIRYETVVSSPTKEIEVVNPIDYMKYYNEALLGRSSTATPRYSMEYINRTASGKYPQWVYPVNDWYDILFKNRSVNHRAGVTIRGGSKVVQYYGSVNYNYDEGMLKTERLNHFDVNIKNHQMTYRVNLNVNLKAGIKLVINSSASLDRNHGPLAETQAVYSYAFNASPVDFPAVYPADDTYNWPHIRFGSDASFEGVNPYAVLHEGYKDRTRYSTINKAEYIQNLSSLVKGLELRLSASLVQSGLYDQAFTTTPYYYNLSFDNYNQETGKYTLTPANSNESASRLLQAGNSGSSTDTRVTYEGRIYHTAAWGNNQTSFTGVFQMYERRFNPISDVLNGQPQRNLTYSGRFSYGYKDRYFIEASGAYNGSERFEEGNRMGFFPALGGSWVVSSEPWMQRLTNVMPYLKFRLSWGKVGNDGVIDTPRYVFMPTLATVRGYVNGQTIKEWVKNPMNNFDRKFVVSYANPDIQWEIAETTNFGVDAKFFKGIFEIQADLYEEIRHNIISQRVLIPAHMGIEYPPLDNIGSTRSRGIDLTGKVQHSFNKDFWFILNGTLTYNKVVYKEIEEALDKPVWQRKVGKEIGQSVGYIAEGLFRDQAEIDNSPRQDGEVMPGDIRYRDINGDGVIGPEDATFIGYSEQPRIVYGFSAFLSFKNWEFNCGFQGSGKRTFFMNPMTLSPFYGNHAMLKAIADSHWSEDNMAQKTFWPRLSTQLISAHNPQENWGADSETRKSTYFMRECRFLRCTSMSIAYNLPRHWLDKMKLQNVKLTLSVNNPFLVSNFKEWDVELGGNGFNYPIQKTWSFGLNVSF